MLFKKLIKRFRFRIKYPKCKLGVGANLSLDSDLGQNVNIGRNTRVGCSKIGSFNYLGNDCNFAYTQIGNFCSIGPEVLCGLGAHPTHFVSSYPGFFSPFHSEAVFFGCKHEFQEESMTTIGSDVWIGARAVLISGINVGTGAIIAAGAVVTKDVPPYGIVGGVPAKLIRFRFSQEIIQKLLATNWWTLSQTELKKLAPYMNDPLIFLEKYHAIVK